MHEKLQNIASQLESKDIPVERNVDLKDKSYFHSGGAAKLLIKPKTTDCLSEAIRVLNTENIPFKVIGETSNLLFQDDCQYTCLVSTTKLNQSCLDEKTNRLIADAGMFLPALSRLALRYSIKGFAGMEGIPGTVGGAVFMNASAYGDGIHLVLESVDVIETDGTVRNMKTHELNLTYRNSIFKRGDTKSIVAKAYFHARPGDQNKLCEKMELVHAKRHKYNEYMYPNLGSAFAGSLYRALGARSPFYNIVSSLYYLINYKFKPFRRESPLNRKWLNDFTIKHFELSFDEQPFSDKTMNTLINKGQHTREHIAYLKKMKELVGTNLEIENEIVEPF